MASRASSRYQSTPSQNKFFSSTVPFDGRSSVSSQQSDSSSTTISSADMRGERKGPSSVKRLVNSLSNRYSSSSSPSSSKDNSLSSSSSKREQPTTSKTSSAIVKSKSCLSSNNNSNMGSMVKKFMDHKGRPVIPNGNGKGNALVIPVDFIADDLKKASGKATKFKSLQEKLLHKVAGKSSSGSRSQKKMLTDSKDARPLSVVLKSEHELLQQNREYEIKIEDLRRMLAAKNEEVEELQSLGLMLKALCSKQQEEIKAFKSSFSTSRKDSSQLNELLEKQGTELKQARLVIPSLQEQVTSLTAQLKFLAEGLAEVKADKDAMRAYFDGHISTPKTPVINKEAEDYTEFCISEPTTPVSQEDMMLKDMNPCLTPYYARTKSQGLEVIGYGLTDEEQLAEALHKLVIGSEHKKDVLQESCINVLRKSVSCSPQHRRVSLGKKMPIADENSLGFANLHCKTPNQKLCWD